jgi:DsbC/DsbD-like thiol-disulfide interchange protein
VLAVVLALTLAGAGFSHGPAKSDSVVKIQASADKPDANGKQVVSITLTMDPGWHTYANPVGNKDMADNETTVKVSASGKPLDAKLEYPAGKVIVDQLLGNYKVYEGKATIKATVQRARGDTGPLQLNIRIQACNDKNCLLPAEVKVPVP